MLPTNQWIKERIEYWLAKPDFLQRETCPFPAADVRSMYTVCEICRKVIPKFKKTAKARCPCSKYSLEYVTKYARKFLKEN